MSLSPAQNFILYIFHLFQEKKMNDQLRIVNEFMAMVDSRKEAMTDQEYLDLCKEISSRTL